MSEAERAPAPLTTAVLTVFLPFAGGYFLSYLYRTVNAVLALSQSIPGIRLK